MPEPYYTTAEALRAKLGVSEPMLSDEEAVGLIEDAEDLVDDQLGNRLVDPDTGRKVVPADEDDWRIVKLGKATLVVAKLLFEDPGGAERQRFRSVSGDISTSSPYGSPYGDHFDSLLAASGLAVRFARVGRGRGGRAETTRQSFFG